MSNFRNHVQLIGNIGDEPKVADLESGKKVCRFPLATNEYYKNAKGQKVESTDWHNIVAWGKTAEIIEKYATKGSEIGVIGKLKTRTYEGHDGNQRYVTEIVANEVLLLGEKSKGKAPSKAQNTTAKAQKETSTEKDKKA
ncbi:single-stranded DNA-binding protein [Croceitalea sp. MTPC9]|uniref:single-stranded DNA-binding protein n=1 Tax=unclassified Croceitalea TaxID=2632280 RepID=UPI002B391EDD|nr:single-stranded DNA-binding protein [Croceitalea sp. MTPC6]GMN16099.1 single-stranded DNA-binding protein [Croceitalea sp. MTPC9]